MNLLDDDVRSLVRDERLVAAAELAESRGDVAVASDLFERACEWARAARAALAAGDAGRALTLAATAGDEACAATALATLATWNEAKVLSVAGDLARGGHHAWAARAYEATGSLREAAAMAERGGDHLAAARLWERLQNPIEAARLLEVGLRRDPDNAALALALGVLLLRHGKAEAALRAFQRILSGAPEKRDALRLSMTALEQLGMTDALAEASHLLAELGGAPPAEAAPVSAALVRARLYGRYEIVREVASTATARVVECLDTVRDERVAIKVFAATGAAGSGRDALMRFAREARVLGQLAHPNVVPLRDVIEQGPALVLAWMPGGTLEARLSEGPLAPSRAAEVTRSVLSALGEAHRLGVVHRDVKPANVLFDGAGGARLSDFGVAHLSDLSVTATAGIFGSVAYMSPEQREGRPATPASDIFGAGAILYEMLTGQRPAKEPAGRPRPTAFHHHLDARHDAVVDAMLEADPHDRPADAFAARARLDALPWPADVDHDAHPVSRATPASIRPPVDRLEHLESAGLARDRWLGRLVTTVRLDADVLARAALFAQVGHPVLQTVLRVDREAGLLWLAAPNGPLDGPFGPAARAAVGAALGQLHAAGFVHGRIDRQSLVVGPDGPVLLFSESAPAAATQEGDRVALRDL